ncbi:beta-galactosidase [Yonghaparkia sp. Root332]|uniref:beta-galactosidase n=1 Tax=Yonghaparkia sp. Root332 TaxID=1736516 RepID=UPI0009E7E548|nr:beta-galactosidase [Yonghaparkia sp. Root332]
MSLTPVLPRTAPAALVPGWPTRSIVLGCDYNPEQWGREVWREDVRLMTELGIDLVAINIFGWAHLEPRDGEFDFGGLDEIIGLLHEAGIRINLGTGTASPPPWLTRLHPEILPRDRSGVIAYPGGRQAWCPSSPVYRERSLALVERVATRYGQHPAIALWHVSNELGCHNAHCYCDVSAAAFRRWLEARYGTIEALNTAWGTAFWSQRYSEWADILPPRTTLSAGNPAQLLDFQRFSSDEQLAQYRAEAAVIRRASSAPVTTNLMVTDHISALDYWSWTADLDLVANDHYLDHRLADPLAELAFSADLTRGLAGGAPWMLMETSTSAVSWQPVNHAKREGELARTAVGHVARGADSVCFFQWRASQRGAEKFHSALLPHAGATGPAWQQSVELSALLDRLEPVVGTRVEARAAMVVGFDARWAAEVDTHPSQLLRYLPEARRYHAALRSLGVTVDMVRPGDALEGYDLVVVPTLYAASDAAADAIDRAASSGATVLVTPFTGIADDEAAIRLGGYPGAFRELLGLVIDELRPLAADETVTLESGATGTIWSEALRAERAEVLDRFATGPAAGSAALTRAVHGAGAAWYVATALEADPLRDLMRRLCAEAGIPTIEVGDDVDIVVRSAADRSIMIVINHRDEPLALTGLALAGVDLVSGSEVASGSTVVPAGGVIAVLTERSES